MSRITCLAIVGFVLCLGSITAAQPPDDRPRRILYIGPATDAVKAPDRANAVCEFLKQRFAEVEHVERDRFDLADPDQARRLAAADVVVLDWSQLEESVPGRRKPLGAREKWDKPLVLLGSAGLFMACQWDVKGGGGCTCLFPLIYNPDRDHPVFRGPARVELSPAAESQPRPVAWKAELPDRPIDVFAIVPPGPRADDGWCTSGNGLLDSPEVEWICGGVNGKTPRHAAIWRQGNLLHFGFEPSPAQMNELGRNLLENSIVYIARFKQDRPIPITPSVFSKRPGGFAFTREFADQVANDPASDANMWDYVLVGPANEINLREWYRTNRQFLRASPQHQGKLVVDEDAKLLGVAVGGEQFFSKCVKAMTQDTERARAAARLLSRDVPDGPGEAATPAAWRAWYEQNAPYLFFSEQGGYRWYIDPLARARGIPSARLRGPDRAG